MTTPEALPGKLFRDGGAGEVCTVAIRGKVLLVRTGADETSLPVDESEFAYGGSDHAKLVVTHAAPSGTRTVLYLPRREARERLLAAGWRDLTERIEEADGRHRRGRVRAAAITGGVVAACVLLAIVANAALDGLIHWGVDRIPVSFEAKLGGTLADAQFPASELSDDPVIAEAIEAIMGRLTAHADLGAYEFRVRVVEDDVPNAFALPGGQIVLLTGLLEQAESPAEVAGVLAHEIQHVLHRHGLQAVGAQLKWSLVLSILLGDLDSTGEMLLARGADFVVLSHSRDAEREADLVGFELLVRAGIDPEGMIRFFETLERENGTGASMPTFLSSHPGGPERIADLRDRLAAVDPGRLEPLPIDWQAVQDRLAKEDPR